MKYIIFVLALFGIAYFGLKTGGFITSTFNSIDSDVSFSYPSSLSAYELDGSHIVVGAKRDTPPLVYVTVENRVNTALPIPFLVASILGDVTTVRENTTLGEKTGFYFNAQTSIGNEQGFAFLVDDSLVIVYTDGLTSTDKKTLSTFKKILSTLKLKP
jgi:hypothetical protein